MNVATEVIRGLPLLPVPYLDETFGSWLFRAAANYHMTTREFVKGIVAVEGQALPRGCDFDTQPPDALFTALTKCSGYRRSELERLVVRQTGSILAPEHRDAYCPQCMRDDRERGVIFFRRAWLDAWTLTCERHQCLLGKFEPIEYRRIETPPVRNLFPARPEAYRRNPSAVDVRLPTIQGIAHTGPRLSVLADLLMSLAGRDLLLLVGSEAADSIIFDLTGSVRLWNAVWYGRGRVPRCPPLIEHPLGDIKTRLSAACFATFLWETLFERPTSESHVHLTVLREIGSLLKPLMSPWSPEERLRLREALSKQKS